MKKIIFCFSLFALYSISAMAQNKHAKADVWVDRFDFEASALKTSENKTLRGENWIPITDYSLDGESTASKIFTSDDKEHGKVLELSYTLNQGKSAYYPLVAILCTTKAATYPSHIVYVAYDFKGPAHTFVFRTEDVTDNNYFRTRISASKEWKTILIPLSDLKQPANGGKQIPFNPDQLTAIEWLIQGITGEEGKLILDNIRFVYTPIEGRNYSE